MAQIKIYGHASKLLPRRDILSTVIHRCVMEVLGLPEDKRAHRYIPLDEGNFLMPGGRSDDYIILEIFMMSGRTRDTRKRLIRRLFDSIEQDVGIEPQDVEICIVESPPENWGFRGFHGDEVQLNYKVDV